MEIAFPSRTLFLTERVPRVCRLTRDEADFLSVTQRGRLELAPTRRRNAYRLTATGHVGVIVAETCRIVIRPKIPLVNFFHLLDPDAVPPGESDSIAATPGDETLNFLAVQFVARLRERVAAGLLRGYAERDHQGPLLQGRLDVPAQLRDAGTHKDQLHSQIDDYTVDVACNRIARATAERLAVSPLVAEGLRAELVRTLPVFADVRAVPVTPAVHDAACADRLAGSYLPLLDLCRLLLGGLGLNQRAGTLAAPTFLLDMEEVFERYVTRGVVTAFASSKRCTVAAQKSYPFHQSVVGQPDLRMRPDVAVERDGRPCLLVDAKWKRTAGRRVPTADVYQMLAYAAGLGVGRVVLVYPGTRDRVWEYALAQAPVRIEVRTLRVTGTLEACRRSLRRFGRALRKSI